MQPLRLHLVNRDLRDEGGVCRGFRVRGVETVFVLHIDHRLAAELLGYQEASGVGAVGRDDSLGGGAHPKPVGRHPGEDDGVHLREVERHRRKRSAVDRADAVLRKELPQDNGVLIGNRGAELR